jgi:FtsZ-binding cell division protein ZapB
MQLQALEQLQEKVDAMIVLVQQLKTEKEELVSRNQGIEIEIEGMKRSASQLPETQERVEALERENVALKEKQEDIKSKVASMLSRIDAVK